MEDFVCASFVQWVEGLGLLHVAQKIREIAAMENFSMAFMTFLSLIDYLSKDDLAALHRELAAWERRQPWEKLKEQGDFWLASENGERAYGFYAKALKVKENAALFNNAAIALMQLGDAALAAHHFGQATVLEPNNLQLQFNHIEALVLAGLFEEARGRIFDLSSEHDTHPELLYFQGEIQFRQRNYLEAARLYNLALEMKYDHDYCID